MHDAIQEMNTQPNDGELRYVMEAIPAMAHFALERRNAAKDVGHPHDREMAVHNFDVPVHGVS